MYYVYKLDLIMVMW